MAAVLCALSLLIDEMYCCQRVVGGTLAASISLRIIQSASSRILLVEFQRYESGTNKSG